MKIFFDCEFIEDGKTIDLISIGMVRDDGAELYLESSEFDPDKASEWVKQNVFPHLKGSHGINCTRSQIAAKVVAFVSALGESESPEFWGYYSAYDHVALCQLFGTMMDLPAGWPYYTRDLRQWADQIGITRPLDQVVPTESEHHALADARWNKKVWEYLDSIGRPIPAPAL